MKQVRPWRRLLRRELLSSEEKCLWQLFFPSQSWCSSSLMPQGKYKIRTLSFPLVHLMRVVNDFYWVVNCNSSKNVHCYGSVWSSDLSLGCQTSDSVVVQNFTTWPCLAYLWHQCHIVHIFTTCLACGASVAVGWLSRFRFCHPIVRSLVLSDGCCWE